MKETNMPFYFFLLSNVSDFVVLHLVNSFFMLKSWFLSRKFCFVFSSYVISVLYIFSNFKACLGFHNIINKDLSNFLYKY